MNPTTSTHWEYLSPGTVLASRYEIAHEIGRGGFSVVYAAMDRQLGQRVAVKLLVPPPASAEVTRERMRREVVVVRELSHQHIVRVHDFVDDGDRSFLVMQLVDGGDLAREVAAHGPLAVESVVRLGGEIAQALSVAHARGVLHRDVKPQNILVGSDGLARLTDFGSARVQDQQTITRTGTLIGTLGYIPPDVIAGQRADVRDDLYALGMTLAFALTGALLARSEGSAAQMTVRDLRPDVPLWLDAVIACATSVDRYDRFPTATSLLQALSTGAAAGSALPPTLEVMRCVVCGTPEPFGSLVCRFCEGDGGTAADTLLVVPGRDRAVARLPWAMSEVALSRLRSQGRDANAVPARLAWTAIPRATWLLAALVAIAGFVATSVGVIPGYWQTVVVLTGLLISAERTIRRPVSAKTPPRWLSETTHDRMLTTLSVLSQGTARSLFSVLTTRVRAFSRLAERHAELAVFRSGVEDLYAASCQAALDLDDTDTLLGGDVPAEAQPNDDGGERSRDLLTHAMLTAIEQVERICALAIDGTQESQIRAAADELSRHVDALQAVERLLAA